MIQKYLEYREGEINLILSAPHSGEFYPKSIPSRKNGHRLKDGYTDRIIKGLIKYFDYKPFYIYSNVHRSRVDLNRNLAEATEGHRIAEKIWRDWDAVLRDFLHKTSLRYRKTLYVDVHSHNDSDEFHFGYGISKKNYRSLIAKNNKNFIRTSLDALSLGNRYDLLFGRKSFEGLLENCGYKIFHPKENEVYFSGGRNVRTYKNNMVGAIQIEIPTPICDRDLIGVISCLGDCINGFMEEFVNDKSRSFVGRQSEDIIQPEK